MRVLVFGDSIAQGFWGLEGGWVERLRKHYDDLALKDLKNNKQPEIFNLGVSGDTTKNLLKRIALETKVRIWENDPLIVVLAIGTNDELFEDNKQWVEPNEFKENIDKLIAILKPISDKIMFVGNAACDEELTTPVFWGNIHYMNEQMQKYEDIIKEAAAAHQIPFVPIFKTFYSEMKKKKLLADGLHPNDEGHQLIFDLVRPSLDKLLN